MKTQEDRGAAYISDVTVQLAQMARTDGFEVLAYLLEMAALEAEAASKKADDVRQR